MNTHYKFMQEEKPRPQNKPVSLMRIEGETLTFEEIAARIGVTLEVARSRMYKLRYASGAITWARLKAFKPRQVGSKAA